MALNKKENNSIFIGLMITATLTVAYVSTQNIDCKGKAFHCINSTHFKICVDLGGGISTTVDDYLIPCPRDTVCKDNNFFECEYQGTTTLTPTEQSDVPNDILGISIWDNFDIPILSTSGTSEVDSSKNQVTTSSPDLNLPILTSETVNYSLISTSVSSASEYYNTNSDISVSEKYNSYQTTASEASDDGFSTKVPEVILNNTINEFSGNSSSTNNIPTIDSGTTESSAQIKPNSTLKFLLQTQETSVIHSNDSLSFPITSNSNYIYNESSTESITTKNLLVTLSDQNIVTEKTDTKTTIINGNELFTINNVINSNSSTLYSILNKVSTIQYENVTMPDENRKIGNITDELEKVSTNPVLPTNIFVIDYSNESVSTTDRNNIEKNTDFKELHNEPNNFTRDLNNYSTSVSVQFPNNSMIEKIVIESNEPNIFKSNNEELIKDKVTETLNISKTTIVDNVGEIITKAPVTYEPVQDKAIDKYILPTLTGSSLNLSVVESYTNAAKNVTDILVTSTLFDHTNSDTNDKDKPSDIKPLITINSTQPIKIYNSLNSTELINESSSKEPLTNFKKSYISHLKKIEGESTVANYELNSNNNNSDIFTQYLTDVNLNTQRTITYEIDSIINNEFSMTSAVDTVTEHLTSYTDINQNKTTTPIVVISYLNTQKSNPSTNINETLTKSTVILTGIDSTIVSNERDTSTTISSTISEVILTGTDSTTFKSVLNSINATTEENILDNLPYKSADNIKLSKYSESNVQVLAPLSVNSTTINKEGDSITKDSSATNNFTVNKENIYTSGNNKSPNVSTISDNERTETPLATTNIQNVSLNEIYLSNSYENNLTTSAYYDRTEAITPTKDRQNEFLDDKTTTNSYTTGTNYNEITEATPSTTVPQKVTLDNLRSILTTSTAVLPHNYESKTTTSVIDAETVYSLNYVKTLTSENNKINQDDIFRVTDSSFMMPTSNLDNVSNNDHETNLKAMNFNNNITLIIDDKENKQSVFTTETINVLTSKPKVLLNNSYAPKVDNNIIIESNNNSLKNNTVISYSLLNLPTGNSLQNLSNEDRFTNVNNISKFDILTKTEPVLSEIEKISNPLITKYVDLFSTPKSIHLNKSQINNRTRFKDKEGSNTNSSIMNSLMDETKMFNISMAGKSFVTSLNKLETTTIPYIFTKQLETTTFKQEGEVENIIPSSLKINHTLSNTLYYSKDDVKVKTNILPHSEIELKNIKNTKDSRFSNNLESFTQDTKTLFSALFTSPKPTTIQKIENSREQRNFSNQINFTKDSLNITEEINKNNLMARTNNLATVKYEDSSRPTIYTNNIPLKFDGNIKNYLFYFITSTLHDKILNNTFTESDVKNKTVVNDKSSNLGSYNEINNIKPLATSTMKSISCETSHNIVHSKAIVSDIQFTCTKRGRYSDKNDCNKFYICIGKSKPIVGICPKNTVFSEIRKQCTRNLAHCIRNNQFRCLAPGRFIDVLTNRFYYICAKKMDGYVRFKLTCKDGYYLNTANIQCMPDSAEDSSRNTSETSTQETNSTESKHSKHKENYICKEEGKFVYSEDCKKYYVCKKNSKSQFRRKLKECDSDEVFDKEKKMCVEDDSYEC